VESSPLARLKQLVFGSDVKRLMWLTLLVKPIGLVTQMLVANHFGAGARYDAYALAFFLVTFLQGALGNAFGNVIIPATIRLRQQFDERVVHAFQNAAILLLLVPALLLMAVVALRTGWLVDLIWPDTPADTRAYLVDMAPVMAVGGIAFLLMTMGKAILNLNKHFTVAGFMPVLHAVVMLAVLLASYSRLGIWGLVAGYVSGMVVCFLVSATAGFRFRCLAPARPHFPPGSLKQLYQLGGMLLTAQILLAINLALDKFFASGLEAGSVSSITYSLTIVNLGSQLFVLSLSTVMFTRMSEYFADHQFAACSDYILTRLRRVGMVVVPVSLGMALAGGEIVRVLFQRGAFDTADAWRTSTALTLYLLGLPALIFNSIIGRIFHSLQRMRERVLLVVQYLVTNLIGNILLVGVLQVRGLAISSSVAINLHLLLGLWVLSRYGTGLEIRRFAVVIGRVYLLGLLTYLVYSLCGVGGMLDAWNIRTTLFGALLVGAVRVGFVCAVFGLLYFIWDRLDRRRATT